MDARPHPMCATRRGFTLIELVIVIGLIAVLATLVVSVGSAVQGKAAENEARAILTAVQGAIETYEDTLGSPPDHAVDFRDPAVESLVNDIDTKPVSGRTRALRANTGVLVRQLRRVSEARKQLEALSEDLFKTSRFSPDPVNDPDAMVELTYMLDSFGTELNYQSNGGAGGTRVVISAGANRVWGDGDDLRSDDQ